MNCPHCGREHKVHRPTDGWSDPKPGDVSLCWKCLQFGVYTKDDIRLPTSDEQEEIENSTSLQQARRAVQLTTTPSKAIEYLRQHRSN